MHYTSLVGMHAYSPFKSPRNFVIILYLLLMLIILNLLYNAVSNFFKIFGFIYYNKKQKMKRRASGELIVVFALPQRFFYVMA